MEHNDRLNDERHGADGPLLVSDPGHIDEVSRWFVQTVQAMGEPYNHDFNGPAQRGVGFYQFMNRHGKRSSAAYAFLAPLAGDPNLTVRLNAPVRRIELANGRAVGVTYRDAQGADRQAIADGEVIVAAGSLVTPQLLMLSGIGPADQLKSHGIACVADLPGVGENLVDHPEVPIVATASGPHGYYRQGVGWRMLRNGLQFKLFGTGPILSAGVEAGAFVNPTDRDADPTIQAFCVPIVYLDRDTLGLVQDGYGLTITTVVIKPKSRGYVRLRSSNPATCRWSRPPAEGPGRREGDDRRPALLPARLPDTAARGPGPARLHPRPERPRRRRDPAHCRRFVKTNYHPVGTCRMGPAGDPMAVLDSRLRVRGVEGLRVCDLSAMPNINAGNTTAPALMLGAGARSSCWGGRGCRATMPSTPVGRDPRSGHGVAQSLNH
jgi:choline dehydrogenase-like flavoprotein